MVVPEHVAAPASEIVQQAAGQFFGGDSQIALSDELSGIDIACC